MRAHKMFRARTSLGQKELPLWRAKLAAKLKGMPREGDKSVDRHKSKTLLGTLAAVVLKGISELRKIGLPRTRVNKTREPPKEPTPYRRSRLLHCAPKIPSPLLAVGRSRRVGALYVELHLVGLVGVGGVRPLH